MCVLHCGGYLEYFWEYLEYSGGFLEYVQYYGHPSPGTEHIFYRVKISTENTHGFVTRGKVSPSPIKCLCSTVHKSGGLS